MEDDNFDISINEKWENIKTTKYSMPNVQVGIMTTVSERELGNSGRKENRLYVSISTVHINFHFWLYTVGPIRHY